jgi:hypothetical protein
MLLFPSPHVNWLVFSTQQIKIGELLADCLLDWALPHTDPSSSSNYQCYQRYQSVFIKVYQGLYCSTARKKKAEMKVMLCNLLKTLRPFKGRRERELRDGAPINLYIFRSQSTERSVCSHSF